MKKSTSIVITNMCMVYAGDKVLVQNRVKNDWVNDDGSRYIALLYKTNTRHIWEHYIEMAEDIRRSPLGKDTYSMRSQTIERVFADAKEKYAMRYTPYRGLNQVTKLLIGLGLSLWQWISKKWLCGSLKTRISVTFTVF